MKLNPKHHNTFLHEQIDIYFDEQYVHYDMDYNYYDEDDMYFGIDYVEDAFRDYSYTYIASLDTFKLNSDRVKNYSDYGSSDYDVYVDENADIHPIVYSAYGQTKVLSILLCVMKVIDSEDKVSPRIRNVYNKLTEKYPELVFKLLDKI